jgi:hypothetical protein
MLQGSDSANAVNKGSHPLNETEFLIFQGVAASVYGCPLIKHSEYQLTLLRIHRVEKLKQRKFFFINFSLDC